MAEICGRLFGGKKLFWSQKKSYAGMFGFIIAAFISTLLFLHVSPENIVTMSKKSHWTYDRLLFVSVVAAFVETLPFEDVDNITVFIASVCADKFITNEWFQWFY